MGRMDGVEPVELVARASGGDKAAWEAIVGRHVGLVHAICRAYGLYGPDADDVNQVVWLRLVENLDRLRQAEAIGAWIATTTRRECLHLLQANRRVAPHADLDEVVPPREVEPLGSLLAAERDRALWAAFARLSAACQRLLRLLIADPRPSYDEISLALDMPVGSIGPTRARCLEQLRRLR